MDLKEVIERVKTTSESAYSSFHAGRSEDAQNYLFTLEKLVVEYLRMPATPAADRQERANGSELKMFSRDIRDPEDVTESATSEKLIEDQTEKPAEVPGAALPATQFDPSAAARQVGGSLTDEKPTQ